MFKKSERAEATPKGDYSVLTISFLSLEDLFQNIHK